MISPGKHWTTLLTFICSMVFFVGQPGISQDLPELPPVPENDAPQEEWEEFARKIEEYIIADQERLAKQQKRSDLPGDYDRFAEAEKRINSPHKYIPVEIKKKRATTFLSGEKRKRAVISGEKVSDNVNHEPPQTDEFF